MKQEDRENDKQGLVSMIRQTKNTLFISGMVLTLAGGLSRAHDEAVAINASFQLPVVEDAVADKGVRSDSLKALLPVYLEIQNITNSPITVSFNSEQSPVYFSEKDAVIKHPKGYPFVCINLALYPYTLKGGQTFISDRI